jgi:multiple sugar transport system substrate-binding protein
MSDTTPIPTPPSPVPVPASTSLPKRRLPVLLFVIIGLVLILITVVASGVFGNLIPRLGTTTLTYWGLWEPESVMRPILDEFEKTHSGIKVNYVMQSPQEYRERLQAAFDQDKGPDIFRIHNTWMPLLGRYLSPLPPSVISPGDYKKTFYPVAQKNFAITGGYAAIPLEYDGLAMYINDDLLATSHQVVPQNWNELAETALAMSSCASPDGTCKGGAKILVSGAALGATNVDHWQDILALIMLQNNVNLSRPNIPTTGPAEDALNYFTSFVKVYAIWDPNLPSSTESFATGKVGIYFAPSWRVFDILSVNPNLHFSIHPVPQLPVDPARGETPVTYANYWAEAVNTKSRFTKESWELLKYLSSAETMQASFQQAISSTRPFGEPFSRVDLAGSLTTNQYLAPIITGAPYATSWYLTSSTRDGQTGINSKISDVYARAVNGSLSVSSLAGEINKVLSEYGINSAAAAP